MPRRRYRTSLFEAEPDRWGKPPFRGRGWHVEYRELTTHRADYNSPEVPDAEELHHMRAIIKSTVNPDGSLVTRYAPQLIVCADSRREAQRFANLIGAAHTICTGSDISDTVGALPEDPQNLEDIDQYTYDFEGRSQAAAPGYAWAARIAAKASHKARWVYAISRLWASYRICAIDWIETHPRYGRRFKIERDSLNHSIMAQSIVAAYSAIEELGLEIRASRNRPSTINGMWNPAVLEDLEARLRADGINLEEQFAWVVRHSPRTIERGKPLPEGRAAEWAGGWIRDRYIDVADAIRYASYLRGKVAAHGSSRIAKSLSLYDVCNMQMIARRLILESLGHWRLHDGIRPRRATPQRK